MKIKLHKDNGFSQDKETYLVISKEGLKIETNVTKRYDFDIDEQYNPETNCIEQIMKYKSSTFKKEKVLI